MIENIIVPMGIYALGFVISLGIAILINGLLKITQCMSTQEEHHN